uniref:Uncharacterized protein n=1 Tax=Heterorhabditis bacteriophora TaxID=37862 RepID=A0A1I7X8I9_HETBA
MPYSTGSTDSGYCTLRETYVIDGSTNFDNATSSITGTDDEEYRNGQRVAITDRIKSSRISKTRRLRKKIVVTPDSGSSCSSEVSSLAGEEERRRTLSFDDIIKRIYVYFQSMLVTIRREQKFCEQIGGLMADADARWGSVGPLNGWLDPSGCFAPLSFGNISKGPAFRGCWAVPHPSVYFSLLATNVKDYLKFLQR